MERKRVLIIEDEPEIRTILAAAFAHSGEFEPVVAEDGIAGIEAAARDKPDVILLDALMPGLDGYATCSRLRLDPGLADVPIVFLTAKADCAEMQKATDCGACACLAKPFDPLKLPTQLSAIIDGARKADNQ